MFANQDMPSLGDFQTWLSGSVGIPASAWPGNDITTSPWPQYALTIALDTVLSGQGAIPGIIYTNAVYNYATAILYMVTGNTPPSTYFTDARSAATSPNFPSGGFGLTTVSTGLLQATSDENSSTTLTAPQWAAMMTVGDLILYKSPWGRAYLAYAQRYGPNPWGLS